MALPSRSRRRGRLLRPQCILVAFFVCWFIICVHWLRRTAVPKAVPAQVVLEPLCGGTAVGGNGSGEAWPAELPAYPLLPRRRVQVLNGSWEFGFVRGGVRLGAIDSRAGPTYLPKGKCVAIKGKCCHRGRDRRTRGPHTVQVT